MNTPHSTIICAAIAILACTTLTACIGASDTKKTPKEKVSVQDITTHPAPSNFKTPDGILELILKDKLNGDLDHYCIDIVGGGPNINPANGLQAHTCFSYRGPVTPDQALDPDLFAHGILKFSAFNVCASVADPAATNIDLKDCDNSSAQTFNQSEQGTLSPSDAPNLCVTVGTDTKFGRGGTSPHQVKSLILEPCDPAKADRQEWRTRQQHD